MENGMEQHKLKRKKYNINERKGERKKNEWEIDKSNSNCKIVR